DAVVVAGIVLRHAQALAAAGRAPVPVGVLRRLTVVRGDELLAEHRHQVLGAIGEVDLQRYVRLAGVARAVADAVVDTPERGAAAGVPPIGRRARDTCLDRP